MTWDRRRFLKGAALAGAGALGFERQEALSANRATGALRTSADGVISASIRFYGLNLLAANANYSDGRVLMLDPTRKPRYSVHQHRALLKINRFFVAQGPNGKPDPVDPSIYVWDLLDMVVTIERPTQGQGLRTVPATTVKCPETPDEWREIRWLPHMNVLVGNAAAAKVDPYHLTMPLKDTRLAARFILSDGVIGCLPPSIESLRMQEIKFSNDGSSQTHQQPCSDLLELRVDPAASLTLVLTPPMGSAVRIQLTAPSGFADPIPVVVENLTAPGFTAASSKHFKALYGVVTTLPPSAKALYPLSPELCEIFRKRCEGKQESTSPLCDAPDFPVYCPPAQASL